MAAIIYGERSQHLNIEGIETAIVNRPLPNPGDMVCLMPMSAEAQDLQERLLRRLGKNCRRFLALEIISTGALQYFHHNLRSWLSEQYAEFNSQKDPKNWFKFIEKKLIRLARYIMRFLDSSLPKHHHGNLGDGIAINYGQEGIEVKFYNSVHDGNYEVDIKTSIGILLIVACQLPLALLDNIDSVVRRRQTHCRNLPKEWKEFIKRLVAYDAPLHVPISSLEDPLFMTYHEGFVFMKNAYYVWRNQALLGGLGLGTLVQRFVAALPFVDVGAVLSCGSPVLEGVFQMNEREYRGQRKNLVEYWRNTCVHFRQHVQVINKFLAGSQNQCRGEELDEYNGHLFFEQQFGVVRKCFDAFNVAMGMLPLRSHKERLEFSKIMEYRKGFQQNGEISLL